MLNAFPIGHLGMEDTEILYEDFCFNCQQAVEKALKGLLVALECEVPRTHSIGPLLSALQNSGMDVPPTLIGAVALNDYAVSTRYPSRHEPVTWEEYLEATELAKAAVAWAEAVLAGQDACEGGPGAR